MHYYIIIRLEGKKRLLCSMIPIILPNLHPKEGAEYCLGTAIVVVFLCIPFLTLPDKLITAPLPFMIIKGNHLFLNHVIFNI